MKKKKRIVEDEFSNVNEEKDLFIWKAPERSLKKRDKDFWVTVLSIYVLSSIILVFAKETFLVFAIGAAIFLYYALSTVEPRIVTNKFTNRGVYISEAFYAWADLASFWFGKTNEKATILFETYLRFPRQLSLIIEGQDKEKMKNLVVKRLPLVKIEPSFIDKTTEWLAKKLPLEDKKSVSNQMK